MDFDAIHASSRAREDMAEEFVFGRLTGAGAEAYEHHLRDCPLCAEAVEQALEFIKLLRRSVGPEH